MRISRPPQAARCRQKLRQDIERALTRFGGPALCIVLEGVIARFRAASQIADVPASTFDKTYAAYEQYLAGRRKSEVMWSYSGWLQHAGLSENFPAAARERRVIVQERVPRGSNMHEWVTVSDPEYEYVANRAHAIPGSFEQPTIPPTSMNLGNGTSELGPMQRLCLAGPDLHAEVARSMNLCIQQNAFEQDKSEAVGRWEIDHHDAAEN